MDSAKRRTITRNRDLLACNECRRRKLKCDRLTPCTTCAKRGDEASCIYHRTNTLERERERRLQAEARLEHLERLVQQLAQNGDGTAHPENALSHQVVDQQSNRGQESGVLASNGLIFNGSTHWSAMLEDIEGLRSAIVPNEAAPSDDHDYEEYTGCSIILGSAAPLPLEQLLVQFLPPRREVDRLTAAYFRSRALSAPFIHASHFRRLYQDFWRDPLKAPVLWISILFSICHVAQNTLSVGKENTNANNRYSMASAHCLALGEYFRPKQFSVESLLLFVQADCLTGLSMSSDLGPIFGLLIRLATKMGYHRDPDIFQLSAFQGEMRRRTWSLCMQMDLMLSFQMGLPSNIQFPTWDTRPPRNLLDSDFDEDTKQLPLGRPDPESTDIIFYIAKHRLMVVFEKILRHTMSTGSNISSKVGELDTEIRGIYSAFPEDLRPRPMTDSIVDSPSLIVTRLCVFFVYQKCLCVLHRPYVVRGQVNSTRICCDAASSIVRCFNDSYQEFLPGGQLETERWFMSNITWHDYLFGVIALCVVLCTSSQSIAAPNIQSAEMLQLLQRAREICMEQSTRSKDSGRVQKTVNATLLHFGSLGNESNEGSMNESDSLINTLEASSVQLPFAGDQTTSQDVMPSSYLQDFRSKQVEAGWAESEAMTTSMDDPSWAYLEQFLNLPDHDLMPT